MAMLIGMSEGYRGNTYEINQPKVTIGRVSSNILTFEHPSISSHHCVIIKQNKQFLLKDLDSTNGTRVNGRDISETYLRRKDLVQFGSVEFVFDAEEGEIEQVKEESLHATVEDARNTTQVPAAFSSISPFKSRKDNRVALLVIIGVIGALAVALLLLFIIFLFTA